MIRINSKVRPVGFPPVSKTLPQAVKKIAETLKPEKIILFGSYAYGNPTPDSDVDLLIVMKTKGSYKENLHAVSMLLYPRPFPVDIIIKTPKEIEEAVKGGRDNSFFLREILKRGKVLYDRHQRT
jgi:predicted nucleotidyltransferase